jgi:uncharacterized OsmC-like protein
MSISSQTIDNGVDASALIGARSALTEEPEGARFEWRATCDWVYGTHASTAVEAFRGLGEEQRHRRCFDFDTDHPDIFASEDQGATPVEYVLVGLAGCLTAGVATIAQHRGIQLHSVRATVEGDMDIQGILGIDSDVRNGFDRIRVRFEIDADATREEIEALVAQSQKRSAVFDIIANAGDIAVVVQ